MTETAEPIEDRLADFTRDKRILLLSLMAVVVGLLSAVVAKALVWLIAIFTNLTFYQRFSSDFVSPTNHHLGAFVIFAPVIGGLIIGLMARYGSEKIRGLARRGFHVTREYSVDPLAVLRVGEVMDRKPPTVPGNMKVSELSDLIANGHPEFSHRQGTLIVDDEGALAGIITRGDLLRAIEKSNGSTVLEAGSRHLIVTYADEILHDAVTRMVHHDIGRLPVVRRDNPQKIVGYLGRASVMMARLRRHEEEQHREAGWRHALSQ